MKGKSDYMLEMLAVKYGQDSFYGKLSHANQKTEERYEPYRKLLILSAIAAFILCTSSIFWAQIGCKTIGLFFVFFGIIQYIGCGLYMIKKYDDILNQEHNKIPKMEFKL